MSLDDGKESATDCDEDAAVDDADDDATTDDVKVYDVVADECMRTSFCKLLAMITTSFTWTKPA